MIKISQMPIYSGALDSVYVPIIRPGGDEWANYRMLASELQGEDGGSVEVENGLYKSLYDVVRWGGPLTENTEIDLNGNTLSLVNITENTTTKILYIDDVTGEITKGTVPEGGASADVEVENALYQSAYGVVRLGGVFTEDTILTSNNAAYHLKIEGVNDFGDGALLDVSTAGNGVAIKGLSTSTYGVQGESGSGGGVYGFSNGSAIGLFGQTNTGDAVVGQSNTGLAGNFIVQPPTTDTVVPIARFARASDSLGAVGMGGSIDYYLRSDNSIDYVAAQVIVVQDDASDTTETTHYEIWVRNAGVVEKKATIYADGNLELHTISGGLIAPSPDGTRYLAKFNNGGTWNISIAP